MAAIFFFSTLTRSTFGFGDALVAMPLLFLVIPVDEARPLGALMSVATALLIVAQDWRKILFPTVAWLIVAAVFGMPLGLLLAVIDPRIAKGTLALALLAFAAYGLLRPHLSKPISPWWVVPTGLSAGALGMAFNMPGPALVVFGTLRRWPAANFRATLQGYFLPTGTIILLWHAAGGAYDAKLLWMFAISLPIVLLAVPIGTRLNRLLHGRRFERYIYGLLIVMALLLLLSVVRDSVSRAAPPTSAEASERLR